MFLSEFSLHLEKMRLQLDIEPVKSVNQMVKMEKTDQIRKISVYDPPEGWKYGFPLPYLPRDGETLSDTLLRDGYPRKLIEKYGPDIRCRFWDSEVEESFLNDFTSKE